MAIIYTFSSSAVSTWLTQITAESKNDNNKKRYLFKAGFAEFIVKSVDRLLGGCDSRLHISDPGRLGILVTRPLGIQTRLSHHVDLNKSHH